MSTLMKTLLLPFFISIALFFTFYPNKSETSIQFIIFKCLPIISLCLFVISNGIQSNYNRNILFGLLFSMCGDVLLIFKDLFIFGMIAFALAHIFYMNAFGFKPLRLKLGIFIYVLSIPALILFMLNVNDPLIKVALPIYIFLIHSMFWRSASNIKLLSSESLIHYSSTFGKV